MAGGVFRRRDPVAYRSRLAARVLLGGAAPAGTGPSLTDAVDAIAAVPAVALTAGSTISLTDAVDGVGGVPTVTVTGGSVVDATITLTDAVDGVAAVPAVTVFAGATVVATDAVDGVAAVPAVTVSAGSTITLTDAVDGAAGVTAPVVEVGFEPDTIDAPAIVGPYIVTGTPNLDVETIDGSSAPVGPVWIANDDSNPFVPTITARLFEADNTTEIANALDYALNLSWLDELNGVGYGRISLPLSDTTGVAALTIGRLIRCYIGGVAAFTFRIEYSPTREEVRVGEERAQVVSVRGRGWAAALDDAIVYPAIPVLESSPDLDSPFHGLDRVFSFASPDFPNDWWDYAVKQNEYSVLTPYRYSTVEIEEGVYDNLPAPVGMPYPNSPIYDGLTFPEEQKAYWIWPNTDAFQEGWAFFRGILVDPAVPREMTVSTTADSLFTLFVDGVPILGEEDDVRMWDGWKDVTITLDETRYYLFACAVRHVHIGGEVTPGGWLMASYYPDDGGAPQDWALTSNHLWTAHFSADTWPGWTPGQIVNQVIDESVTRGSLNSSFVTSFTSWRDTYGRPWNTLVNGISSPYVPWFSVRVGSPILSALNELHEEGWVDWRMGGGGYTLDAWAADATARDSGAQYLSDGTSSSNIVEMTREYDRPVINALLAVWSGGMVEVEDAASIATYGRREDVFNTNASSEEDARRLATVELGRRCLCSEGGAISITIEPLTDTDTPYISYFPGDLVTIPSLSGGTTQVRVLSITVEQDDEGDPIFTLELNRRFPVPERSTNRLLQEIGGKSYTDVGRRGSS